MRIPYTDPFAHPTITPPTARSLPGAVAALQTFLTAPLPSGLPPTTAILSGAGLSVASGLADYRGPAGTYRVNKSYRPIYHHEFLASHEARKRYWARSYLGWPTLHQARPNAGHYAVRELARLGLVSAVVTQNVDSFHPRAHPATPTVELHGYLRATVCTSCRGEFPRDRFQEELARLNPVWAVFLSEAVGSGALATEDPREKEQRGVRMNPDGDVDVPGAPYSTFRYPACPRCKEEPPMMEGGRRGVVEVDDDGAWRPTSTAGVLKPAVVMFGESISVQVKQAAEEAVDGAGRLLVLATSLATYSAWRLAKRATDRGMPIAIVNMGGVRGEEAFFAGLDPQQTGRQGVRVEESTERLLPTLVEELRRSGLRSLDDSRPGMPSGDGEAAVFKDLLKPILTSARRVNASNSFLSAIIWMDMEPISRKMTMKKVAGFHSLDFFLLLLGFSERRRNFGTMDFQNEGWATSGTTELTKWAPRSAAAGVRRAEGARSALRIGKRFIVAVAQADAVRTAVTSVSTCTPATVALLKSLLVSTDDAPTAKAAPRPRANTAAPVNARRAATAASAAKKELTLKEKANFATAVINVLLKALTEASRGPPTTATDPSRRPAPAENEPVKATGKNTLRRSLSAPSTPLQPRPATALTKTLSGANKSPPGTKHGREPSRATNTANLLSAAECARVALASLRQIQDSGKSTFVPLQLETAMSHLITKLTTLGLHEQAIKEMRILRKRLGGAAPTKPEPAKGRRTPAPDTKSAPQTVSELLDFGTAKLSSEALSLVVIAQTNVLQILSGGNKPSSIDAALPNLRHDKKSSPTNICLTLAEDTTTNSAKIERALERIAYFLLVMAGSPSSNEDASAQDPRLSPSPATVFELQVTALEARLHWWRIAKHQGDVDKDIVLPFSRYMAAFARRAKADLDTVHTTCRDTFSRLKRQYEAQNLTPSGGSRSPLNQILQTLAGLARRTGHLDTADRLVSKIREGLDPKEDTAAKMISVAAQLLAIRLKNPAQLAENDDLLSEVVAGIQAPLRGDYAQLDELLEDVCAARKAATALLYALHRGDDLGVEPPEKTRDLLETLILQCPRFCLRWMGKPPGPTSSTKEYLRYEQRRQQMQETIQPTLDSTFMVLKIALDKNRMSWTAMETILESCSTLMDYLGTLSTTESGSSNYPKISHFYYLQFASLRKASTDPKDAAPMRALRKSVECMKNRPSAEKERAQLDIKLEKLADVYEALGREKEALGVLEMLRTSLLEDGVLAEAAQALQADSLRVVWGQQGKRDVLSRTLVSISEMGKAWVDWTGDRPEPEQAVALEHHLHFILRTSQRQENDVTLQHPVVDTLLRTYIPTRFPIRRFRVLIDLLFLELGKDGFSELVSVARDAAELEENGPLWEDAGLAAFIPHMKALYHSLTALSDACCDIGIIQRSLSAWQSITASCQDRAQLEKRVDDVEGLLCHLQSVVDFLRMKGHDSVLATALELSADISRVADGSTTDSLIHHSASLALQYTNLGQSSKADDMFARAQGYVEVCQDPGESVASFHLAFAEHLVTLGNFKKAEEQLHHAQAAFIAGQAVKSMTLTQRKYVAASASYLHSLIALERGDSHHALVYARESIRALFQDWLKLEVQIKAKASPDVSMADASSTTLSSVTTTEPSAAGNRGPQFWRLFHMLFRNMLQVSSIYAHMGMFVETVYYAEQAQKLAKGSGSELYNAQCAAWMGSLYAKAAKPQKSLEMLELAMSLLPDETGGSYSLAVLSCEISSLYLHLKNTEGADLMLAKAEAFVAALKSKAGAPAKSDMAVLEDGVGNLNIDDKPPARTTRRTVRQPPVAKTTATKAKAAPAKAKAVAPSRARAAAPSKAKAVAAPPKPVVVLEDPLLAKLRASILVQSAAALLERKEWTAALAVFGEAAEASKASSLVPASQVAMAACLMGMSMDQMAKDPVFSVIQDSTISFPAVSTASDKEMAVGTASPPGKGRVAAPRGGSKEATRGYVENLKQAQDYLVEAHSVATLSGDSDLVHRISCLLQNIGLLLSATSSKARAFAAGHTSFSVEFARNTAWRRERRALYLEKTKPEFDGHSWPPSLHANKPRRSSLGLMLDLCRIQRDYIDILPKSWSVISLSLSENNHDLCIRKFQAGQTPFLLRLPLERASSRDLDTDVFNFQQGRAEMLEIIAQANETSHDAKDKDMSAKGAKTRWWEEREALDLRLKDLLENIEQIWLGGFRGIFSQHARRTDLLARFQKSFLNILDRHLPSRRQVRGKKSKTAPKAKVTLDPRILDLFIGLGDSTAPGVDFDDELTDLLYFVVDILQFHGETNAYDEIDFDSMVVESFDALQAYHMAAHATPPPSPTSQQQHHTILLLDKPLHAFPWESLPCLQPCAVSRMPNLDCLRRVVRDQPSPNGHYASSTSGTYILNPSSDLPTTQSTFSAPLAAHLPPTWASIVARPPTEPEFEQVLTEKDILLYFGHGSGAQYIRARTVRRLEPRCRATVLLMGCSSAHLTEAGEFEVYGPAWNYMMAGCPAAVGTLWDVTDRDIDRFGARVVEEWGLVGVGSFPAEERSKGGKDWGAMGRGERTRERETGERAGRVSLVEAVGRGREACRFRYLTGAAAVVYGVPVYVEKGE
ncbi:peptidase family C50-domain-containing protein [Schizothecium vesticola]|uniref:separase n=1 Tax=Schizothecium vesticola TaxID=314040 RepID=A0AA40F8H1_9PEZI|nr:peptidase family C50-domain-containing protein [Schizothecium vesticola]